jgi:hypothetical protein
VWCLPALVGNRRVCSSTSAVETTVAIVLDMVSAVSSRSGPELLPEVPAILARRAAFDGALKSAPWFDTVVFAVLGGQAEAPTRAAFHTAMLPR